MTFLSVFLAAFVLLVAAPSAIASTSGVGWGMVGNTTPTNLVPGGEGDIELLVYKFGAGETSAGATFTDTLPEGLAATGDTHLKTAYDNGSKPLNCPVAGSTVTCELPALPIYAEVVVVEIEVKVTQDAPEHIEDRATVSGGGSLGNATTAFPITVSPTPAKAGLAHFDTWLTNADGTMDTQAGSHPYDLTTMFTVNKIASTVIKNKSSIGGADVDVGEPRNINVNYPPGVVGNPEALPQCPRLVFLQEQCPLASQIGVNTADAAGIGLGDAKNPVYNLVPPTGLAAQFGFHQGPDIVYLNAGVRTGGDNGITVHVPDVPEKDITENTTTIWGVPAESSHDYNREGVTAEGKYCEGSEPGGVVCPAGVPLQPFLTMPTSCGSPPEFSIEMLGTWQEENLYGSHETMPMHDSEENPIGLTGCEHLRPFGPSIAISPDTAYADTPAGLTADVTFPQGLNPEGLATSGLENTTTVLPEGVVINPGQATGLQACQPSQEAMGTLPDGEVNEGPVSCPSASKVGTVEIASPVLPGKLYGDIYILTPNPPHVQILLAASGFGVNLKIIGNVTLNETTGQLTTTFEKTPDFPVTEFKLAFSGGAQAALATPTACGTYESTTAFTPWASPFVEGTSDSSRFQITSGPLGSPCVNPMPFAPTMTAGATTDQAGGYTSFTMLLQRGDEQQRIKRLSFKTPEGLLGMISKVPLCPEPQASQGTCSSASQIGHTVVGTGPGPYPFYIPQASAPPAPIYLTGPYKGAPFGLSIVVPLIAGPFNLGTEIVRATITVDPRTSQITVTTDPLPQVVKGIPTDLRSIDAVIDRPEFMFNPTDCNPMSFSGTSTSNEGATASLSTHFQVGSCQALKFQPNFKVSTSGKTSRADGASLTAKIVYPVGNLGFNQASSQSNIKSVKVDLPKQLPSRLTTLQKACPAKTFEANPALCPADSIVGHGKAITPLLPVPVEGPAYFVSHAGEEFPNLIVVLQGDNVTVDLVGSTFIDNKTNITSSTFKEVPDVPIQSFELKLPQGKDSALAANVNLCKVKGGLKMPTAFTGQNGAVLHQSTPIGVTGCAKSKPKKVKTKKKHTKGKKKK